MKTVTEAEFKEHCSELIDTLDEGGIEIVRDGHPVARVVAPANVWDQVPGAVFARLRGALKDEIVVHGDLMTTGLEWDAQS